jgi:hypothetical protein
MIKIYTEHSHHYNIETASKMKLALFHLYKDNITRVRIEQGHEFEWVNMLKPNGIEEIIDKYFPPQEEKKIIPLLHPEYETYNDSANLVASEFNRMIDAFIDEKMERYSSVELEYILMSELSMKLSEKRLTRNLKIKKNKRS